MARVSLTRPGRSNLGYISIIYAQKLGAAELGGTLVMPATSELGAFLSDSSEGSLT